MALINCPECNEKISSTVKQCVHCGAKIIVCPECESIFTGDMEKCPTCGFAINSSAQPITKHDATQKNEDKTDSCESIRQHWIASIPVKKFFFGNALMAKLPRIISILAYLVIFTRLLPYLNGRKSIVGAFVFFLFLQIIAKSYTLITTMLAHSDFNAWAMQHKLNFNDIIKHDLATQSKERIITPNAKSVQELKNVMNSNLYGMGGQYKVWVVGKLSLDVFLSFLQSLFEIIFFNRMFAAAKFAIYAHQSPNLIDLIKAGGLGIIVLGIIAAIAQALLKIIFERKEDTLRYEWVKENAPESIEVYERAFRSNQNNAAASDSKSGKNL